VPDGGLLSVTEQGKSVGQVLVPRPSIHSFANDPWLPITRSRASRLLDDHGRVAPFYGAARVGGANDRLSPPAKADRFNAAISGSREVLIDKARHYPFIEHLDRGVFLKPRS
jgi:hypothetical protein